MIIALACVSVWSLVRGLIGRTPNSAQEQISGLTLFNVRKPILSELGLFARNGASRPIAVEAFAKILGRQMAAAEKVDRQRHGTALKSKKNSAILMQSAHLTTQHLYEVSRYG